MWGLPPPGEETAKDSLLQRITISGGSQDDNRVGGVLQCGMRGDLKRVNCQKRKHQDRRS